MTIFRFENITPDNLFDFTPSGVEDDVPFGKLFTKENGDVVLNLDYNDRRARLLLLTNERELVGQVTSVPDSIRESDFVAEIEQGLRLGS